jgi:hypothetical protein
MSRFTFGIALILGGTLILYFLAWPQWQEASATRERVTGLQSLSAELDDLLRQRDRLLQTYRQTPPEDLLRLEELAPLTLKPTAIVTMFDAIAQKNRVSIGQIDVGSVTANAQKGGRPTGSVEVTMTVDGTLAAFESFLRDVERSVHITDISQITFAGDPQEGFSANISGTMYFRR